LPHAVTIAGGHRYIRVLSTCGAAHNQLSLISRYELQHALEKSPAPGIRCADDITRCSVALDDPHICPPECPDCFENERCARNRPLVLEEVLTSTKTVPRLHRKQYSTGSHGHRLARGRGSANCVFY
jgi:hypothetical protein